MHLKQPTTQPLRAALGDPHMRRNGCAHFFGAKIISPSFTPSPSASPRGAQFEAHLIHRTLIVLAFPTHYYVEAKGRAKERRSRSSESSPIIFLRRDTIWRRNPACSLAIIRRSISNMPIVHSPPSRQTNNVG